MSRALLILIIAIAATTAGFVGATPKTPHREVAITFDDLPVITTSRDTTSWNQITNKLLAAMRADRVPIVGFVNETKLYPKNKLDPARVALLKKWLDAGLELGNHTFSHRSLNSTPLSEFESDVLRGETVTRGLVEQRQRQLRYFRHPFLHTGRSIETRQQFESFLRAHGYTVAPVTIDNSDWIFARAYDNARDAKDAPAMKQIGEAYVPYMEAKVAYFETQSSRLFDREIRQVLLLHANSINADYFPELLAMLKRRGYEFITLERALGDKAYGSPDNFTGPSGISWLDRWALTRRVPKGFFQAEPRTPAFVMKLAEVQSE